MENIQMIQGDCFEILPTMEAGSVDAVITDPPYGTTALPWDKKIDLPLFWDQIKRVIKPGAVVVMFSQQPFTTDVINSNRAWFRYELIWRKNAPIGFLDVKRRPMRVHENILVFCEHYKKSNDGKRAAMTYNPQMTVGKPYTRKAKSRKANHYDFISDDREIVNSGTRYPVDVLDYPNRGGKSYHPTQKPVELMEWLVRTFTNEGDLVLDPFAGAGSTLVACEKSDRQVIGIESDQKYFSITKERFQWNSFLDLRL
jgi:site-specific DNA-methyltransferase (adenine-specific)